MLGISTGNVHRREVRRHTLSGLPIVAIMQSPDSQHDANVNLADNGHTAPQ
jgi:hypothetical protein